MQTLHLQNVRIAIHGMQLMFGIVLIEAMKMSYETYRPKWNC